MADSIVTVEKVSLKYKKTVLTDVTITAEKGDVIGLLGLNGSGKSTLLSAIAGLRRASSGTIKVGGKAGFVLAERGEGWTDSRTKFFCLSIIYAFKGSAGQIKAYSVRYGVLTI